MNLQKYKHKQIIKVNNVMENYVVKIRTAVLSNLLVNLHIKNRVFVSQRSENASNKNV